MTWRRTLSTWVGATSLEVLEAVVVEHGEHDPPILFRRPALDEPGPDEPVEAAGQAAGGELQPGGQVAHAHRVVGGLGQVHEDLVVAERQPVRGEVGLERGVEVEHRLGVGAPRRHLLGVEPPRCRSSVDVLTAT